MIDPGEFDQRGRFESKVIARDALNQGVPSWVPEYEQWAKVGPITGRYAHVANQMQAIVGMQVEVRRRGRTPVSELWRFVWIIPGGERFLAINSVLPNDDKDGWILLCSEGTRDGN